MDSFDKLGELFRSFRIITRNVINSDKYWSILVSKYYKLQENWFVMILILMSSYQNWFVMINTNHKLLILIFNDLY